MIRAGVGNAQNDVRMRNSRRCECGEDRQLSLSYGRFALAFACRNSCDIFSYGRSICCGPRNWRMSAVSKMKPGRQRMPSPRRDDERKCGLGLDPHEMSRLQDQKFIFAPEMTMSKSSSERLTLAESRKSPSVWR